MRSLTRTFTAVDDCGNEADEVSVTVTWKVDTEAPVITAEKQDAELECNPTQEEILAALGGASVEDNCDAELTAAYTDGDVIEDGCMRSLTRTFTAVDDCGNEADEVSVTVTWKVDTEAPQPNTEPADLQFACGETVSLSWIEFTDNCDEGTVAHSVTINGEVYEDPSLYIFPEGVTEVCYSASDACGNTYEKCITVTVVPCEMRCETAFGMNPAGNSICFIGDGFDRWGWTNQISPENSYTFDLYAGAAGCDPSKGEFVGTVDVEYWSGNVTVTYNMVDGYFMTEAHIYVGSSKYPSQKKGRTTTYTVAPGQYTYTNGSLSQVTSFSQSFSGQSGNLYVIAHAVTCTYQAVQEVATTEKSGFIGSGTIVSRELDESNSLKVYPNPFNNQLYFEFSTATDSRVLLELYDLKGSKIKTLFEERVRGGQLYNVQFMSSELTSGTYYYRLVSDSEVKTGKLVKNY